MFHKYSTKKKKKEEVEEENSYGEKKTHTISWLLTKFIVYEVQWLFKEVPQ